MPNVLLEHVSFSYDREAILGGVDMEVTEGSFVCILGQSGCGKSTLLRLLAGLEKPESGRILVGGKPVAGAGLDRGVVFQDYGLFPWMTAGENILIALKQKFKNMSADCRRQEAFRRLREVELDDAAFRKLPGELSGGMKQRCAIARAFGIDPPVLLMDEPFGALDAVTRFRLQDLVLSLWQKETPNRKTIFFVTHDVDEALFLATDIFVLGQAPSKIIYSYSFGGYEKPERKEFYGDTHIVGLRNELMGIINDEVMQLKAGSAGKIR
ncbi:MAG: ABC transporter ATP-binding protein [Synergistaceae bacterium]|jgi:NitT/TauT family transport system ATP-binding protein|nr:ABC transporter ATP-binding protein [Synergistaceae bacterium]